MTPSNQTATATAAAIQNEATQAAWLYSTVQQFNKKYPAFPVGTLRHQIFNEETNGLKKPGPLFETGDEY